MLDDKYINLIIEKLENIQDDEFKELIYMLIKDNLKLVNDNFGNIVYVCTKLGIHNDISKLKYGYDTLLNSKDDTLKPNTKIMLNIARILLKNTKVMIFEQKRNSDSVCVSEYSGVFKFRFCIKSIA